MNDTTSAYTRITTDITDPALHERMPDNTFKKYLVLPDIARINLMKHPLRTDYVHKCGHGMRLMLIMAETIACNPRFYSALFCMKCGTHRPIAEFVWAKEPNIHVGQ